MCSIQKEERKNIKKAINTKSVLMAFDADGICIYARDGIRTHELLRD